MQFTQSLLLLMCHFNLKCVKDSMIPSNEAYGLENKEDSSLCTNNIKKLFSVELQSQEKNFSSTNYPFPDRQVIN